MTSLLGYVFLPSSSCLGLSPCTETRAAERVCGSLRSWLRFLHLTTPRYVESLENRLEKMEALLQKVRASNPLNLARSCAASYAPTATFRRRSAATLTAKAGCATAARPCLRRHLPPRARPHPPGPQVRRRSEHEWHCPRAPRARARRTRRPSSCLPTKTTTSPGADLRRACTN
jgi:hypothetical protein